MTRRGWGLFLALGLIWGIPYLLIKIAVRELTPASLVFLRTALGAAVLLPAVARRVDARALLARWRPIVLFAIVEVGIPWLLLSDAERRVTSSLAGLFMASVPLIGALLARVTGRHEPLGARRLTGLLVGLAGVIALLGLDLGRGDAVAIAAARDCGGRVRRRAADRLAAAGGRPRARRGGVVARAQRDLLCAGRPGELPASMPGLEVIVSVVVLGLVCTALAFLLFFRLIAEAGPVRATVITYVNPAVAVAAGVALLGEPFTLGTGLGFVLILAGSWLATGPAGGPGRGARDVEPVTAE